MRERGDLGLSATGDVGATATWPVVACICRGLRRQYAITSLPFFRRDRIGPFRVSNAISNEAARRSGHAPFNFAWLAAILSQTRGPVAAKNQPASAASANDAS